MKIKSKTYRKTSHKTEVDKCLYGVEISQSQRESETTETE